MKLVECKKCRWQFFEVSLQYCLDWEADWVIFWNKSSEETRSNYGCKDAPPKIEQQYLNCHCGNSYKDFQEPTRDIGIGHTYSAILAKSENFKR